MLTPTDLLTAAQPGGIVIRPDRKMGLQMVSHWDVKTSKTHKRAYLFSLDKNDPRETRHGPLMSVYGAPEVFWYSNEQLGYLKNESMHLITPSELLSSDFDEERKSEPVLRFPKGINASNLQARGDEIYFTAQVWEEDGDFGTVEAHDREYEDRPTSALVFEGLPIRQWDHFVIPGKVWTLGKVSIKSKQFINLLYGKGLTRSLNPLEFKVEENIVLMNYGDRPHGDWRTDVITLSIDGTVTNITSETQHGGLGCVTLSPDGQKIAWAQPKGRNGIEMQLDIMVHDLTTGKTVPWTNDLHPFWIYIVWSEDSKSLFSAAPYHGRNALFWIKSPAEKPIELLHGRGVTGVQTLDGDRLLLSTSSFHSLEDHLILDVKTGEERQLTTWSIEFKEKVDEYRVEDCWFKGADRFNVQSWIIKPAGYDDSRKRAWPMIVLVHGGPFGATSNEWTRSWNPTLFAAQGYLVMAINPTGSYGFGSEFMKRTRGSYAGRAFKDIVAGYRAALHRYPGIDPARTAVAGPSYGGYMANWIQGHNDQIGFKTIICHDGFFDLTYDYFTNDTPQAAKGVYGGSPWENRDKVEMWNPLNHVKEWNTPELVIHGGKDYRIDQSQGIATFTALQMKGVPSRLIYFPDEPHSITEDRNMLYWYQEVFGWLDQWIGVGPIDQKEETGSWIWWWWDRHK